MQGQTQRGGLAGGRRGFGPGPDKDKDSNKPTGTGGMTPGPGPGGMMVAGATPDPFGGVAIGGTTEGFAGQATPGGGGGQSLQDLFAAQTPVSTAPVSAAPEYVEEEEEKKTTNSIIEALFNKNLTFEYDPVADYVNRVYGGLRPDQKKKMLARLGYDVEDMTMAEALSTFGDVLDESGQALYDAGNLQFSDFKNPFKGVELKAPTIPSTVGGIYDAIVGGMTLPYTQAPLAFLQGNIPGMFLSLAFGKGPYQMEDGEIVGDVANLQTAPQDYIDAVISKQGELTDEQIGQISMGSALRAEEQQATRGPAEVYIPPSTGTTSGVAAAGTGTTQGSVDYQGIYNNFSPDQRATADKIMAMDEYDLPYAVDYVRMGGPLF